jgi:hypothetical protein
LLRKRDLHPFPQTLSLASVFVIVVEMLTGLELIGLALSIAPLLTEAIEHHQTRVVSFRAANKETHKKWTKEFFADLNYEICMLRRSLQKLVMGLSVDEETKTKLLDLENFDRELWRTPDPALQQCFKLRLSDFADSFVESLTTILKHLDKVIGDDTLPHAVAENNIVGTPQNAVLHSALLTLGNSFFLAQRRLEGWSSLPWSESARAYSRG